MVTTLYGLVFLENKGASVQDFKLAAERLDGYHSDGGFSSRGDKVIAGYAARAMAHIYFRSGRSETMYQAVNKAARDNALGLLIDAVFESNDPSSSITLLRSWWVDHGETLSRKAIGAAYVALEDKAPGPACDCRPLCSIASAVRMQP